MRTTTSLLLLTASLWGMSALAQGNFEDFLKKDAAAEAREGVDDQELQQFEEVLNGEDTDRALRAMRYMLTSGKPPLVRRAKEFGLYAAEPLFRNEALRAILDTGGPFLLEIQVDEGDSRLVANQFRYWGASASPDNSTLYFSFGLQAYDAEKQCWPSKASGDCSLQVIRSDVTFNRWGDNINGALKLTESGVLEGTMAHVNKSDAFVPVRIRLIE